MDKFKYIAAILSFVANNAAQQYPPFYQNQYGHYDMDPYDDYESPECFCSCEVCEELQPCCRNICVNCQPSSSIVLVPYPYPLIISTKQKESTPQPPPTTTETTQTTTTTSATTQTTTQPVTAILRNNDAYINDILSKTPNLNKKSKFVLTNLRRTKPDCMPKYGIVPIPDNLAEKLMLQLRSMRVLHPKKETFKPADVFSSLEKL
ncbi:unnamed protein product [Leptosia nina]|uniref:Uncharacterized protein n=1 Tax=Leptosia nina TaxID=320188 RepID=A0AAV1JPC9_9NEOP